MNVEGLIKQHLTQTRTGQLATSINNLPWACTVHYYSDTDLNIYWLSTPERRHSKEIAQNPHVALAVKVHEDTPDENYIIGISISGTAELIGAHIDEKISKAYIEKLGRNPQLLKDIAAGTNPHKFYRLVPKKFVLFDTKNFTDNPKQEWQVNA